MPSFDEQIDYMPLVQQLQARLKEKWEYEAATYPASKRSVRAFVEACDAYGARVDLERPEVSANLGAEFSLIDDLVGGQPITAIDLDGLFDYLEVLEALIGVETAQ